jgi:hypothetical protein
MARKHILDPAAEGRLARTLFASALMSDSKWRKLFTAVRDKCDFLDRMIVKFIDVDEPKQMRFPPDLQCPRAYMDTIEFGPVALRSIEWVEFNGDLTDLLGPSQFKSDIHDGRTRIFGYSGLQPSQKF